MRLSNPAKPLSNPAHRARRQRDLVKFGVALLLVVGASSAMAGTGGTDFDAVWTTISDWMQGTLGRVVAGAMVLVGIVGGVVRQSIMAFATGIGGGVGLYNTPKIIESIMSATLPSANDMVYSAAPLLQIN